MYKYQGFTTPLWSYQDSQEAEASLNELKATGANTIIIDAHLSTTGMTGNVVDYEYPNLKADLEATVKIARSLGLDVWFKPIVIVGSGPDRHEWQRLAPTNPGEWFASYEAKLKDLAYMLQANGVSHFLLTNELHSLTTNPENSAYWKGLVSGIRSVFNGEIGFNCGALLHPFETGNEMLKVPQDVLDQLDFIGLSSYPRLQKGSMTMESVEAGWLNSAFDQNLAQILSNFASSQSLPIYFTELGSPAYAGGNWDYGKNFEIDLPSQANFYSASLPFLQKYFANEIEGVFVYNWLFNERTDSMQNAGVSSPYDWNVNEKPAEAAISDQFLKPQKSDVIDIHVLPFSQAITGTKNIDQVIFGDTFSSSSITRIAETIEVSLGDRTYSMQNVERFLFEDKALAIDINAVPGQAYRIYKAAFDRTPDVSGLGYWIAQMDTGMDVVEVAARFIDSPEFSQLYGSNVSNATFITNIYKNVLDRNPDYTGLAWWVNEMQTNPSKTWQKVLADFSESAENKANVAALIANGITYDPWE
jgi:hypothetical protein